MGESLDETVARIDGRILKAEQSRQAQLDRIETKLDEVLAFRDLLLEIGGPFLKGGKSSVWLAMLAKTRGRPG